MTDNKKPLVVVLGATGNQGGSVIESLLKLDKFRLRGVTRNAKSDKAAALKAKGVEIAEGDIRNKAQLVAAFQGAWGVFSVTQFWDPEVMKNPELEFTWGCTAVDAAVEAKVGVFVWSGLANSDGLSNKKWHVPHFTNKWRVEEYARSKKQMESIFVYAGFYAQNFMGFMPPKKGDDGVYNFALPMRADVGLPMFDVSDTGRYVAPIFDNHKPHVGKVYIMAGEYITMPQVAKTFQAVTGLPARFTQLPLEAFKDNHEMMHMFGWFNEFGYAAGAPLEESLKLAGSVNTFDSFLRKTGWKP